jgi:hypothetical protein
MAGRIERKVRVTPDAFTAGATAWIDAVTTVMIHLFGKLAVISAGLASGYVWLQQRGIIARLDAHKGRLDALEGVNPPDAPVVLTPPVLTKDVNMPQPIIHFSEVGSPPSGYRPIPSPADKAEPAEQPK